MSALSYFYSAADTADVQLRGAPVTVHGCSVRETAGAAAALVLRDGTSVSAPGIICVNLAANESVTIELTREEGIQCTTALFLDRVSGSTEVTVWA